MKKQEVKILLVDDHPLIIEGYKNALLSSKNNEFQLAIDTAENCDSGFQKIKHSSLETHYDIVFLDIQLPASSDGMIVSGEDLGIKTRELLPDTKIAVLTMFSDNFRLYNIMQSINPDGFLVKTDVNTKEILHAFEIILKKPPYYSQTVLQFLQKKATHEVVIDETDRLILHHLSCGASTKEIAEFVYLSLPSIDKRKQSMKKILGVETSKGNKMLLDEAKKRGFI